MTGFRLGSARSLPASTGLPRGAQSTARRLTTPAARPWRLIRGVFTPERFLDLVVDYVAFEVVDGGVKSKKLAGYHQFHAVRKALASTIEAAGEGGQHRGGVVWHTQGSGKSLTMLFFVRQLQLAKALKNPTIVVVTDRNDLDDQVAGTFNAHSSALAHHARPGR